MEQIGIHDMKASDLVPVQDVWRRPLRPEEMLAYRELGEKGVITKIHAVTSRSTGITIMSYAAIGSEAWVHNALKEAVRRNLEDGYAES